MKKNYALKQKIKKFLKDNCLILALIILFFSVKAAYLFKAHNVIWDEAVYLGIGKYIFSHGRLGFWEIVRPIGLPLTLGLIWRSGLDYIFFSEFIAILFSVGCLILTYLIGREVINKEAAFIASSILAVTSVFFLYTNYILTGIPSTFFVLFGIYVYLKKRSIFLSGILCGLGALFRFPQALILVSFILAFFIPSLYKKDIISFLKKSGLFSSGFFLTQIPFIIFNYIMYHKETSKVYHALFRPWILGSWAQSNPAERVITSALSSRLYNIFYYVIQLFKENTLFIFIIPGLIFIFRERMYKKERFSIILAAFSVYLIYFTYIMNKQARFLLVFLPYAALITAYGFYSSFLHAKKDRIRILIVLFVIISLVGVLSRDMNYYNWRLKDELPIVHDYYKFFANKEIIGTILTTDPVPAAYTDAGFIPFYFSVDTGQEIYNSNKGSAFAVIFSPESFYCTKEDAKCKTGLKNLSKSIEDENTLVLSEIYRDRAYYIYLNRNIAQTIS